VNISQPNLRSEKLDNNNNNNNNNKQLRNNKNNASFHLKATQGSVLQVCKLLLNYEWSIEMQEYY